LIQNPKEFNTIPFFFIIGRFAGTAIMKFIAPNKLLAIYGVINIILCAVTVWFDGMLPIYALMAIFFFESIMFPTIFALGVKNRKKMWRHSRLH